MLHSWEALAAAMPTWCGRGSVTDGFRDVLVAGKMRRSKSFADWYSAHGNGVLRVADGLWFDVHHLAQAWLLKDPRSQGGMDDARFERGQTEKYELGVRTMGYGRRLVTTVRGNMGLAPAGTQEGDVVVFLLATRMKHPFSFVLRPGRDGTYTMIGTCYLYEMDVEKRFHAEELTQADFIVV